MPELPEVETIRKGLESRLLEKSIVAVEVRAPKLFVGNPEDVYDLPIAGIARQGKLLAFRFQGDSVLTIHLKMTGQLIWKPAEKQVEVEDDVDNAELEFEASDDDDEDDGAVVGGHPEKAYLEPLPHKHTHVILRFDDGSTLYFNDLRKFGRLQVLPAHTLSDLPFLQSLGPEPLEGGFTRDYLAERLNKHPKQPIKSFLLDQTNIAGLGNIYADESLFRAAILPDRLTGSLKSGEVRNLFDAIQETLEVALRHGGSSSRDYVNAVGEKGTFLKVANVYHRQGQLCNRCLVGTIERKKIGGRSSHFCPKCQF
ncbi:MAG: bifunctional DNA-formamidopyrimidine glycosylase/DNA-(apurinic or apyrimidinic site) lyase [bacterium]